MIYQWMKVKVKKEAGMEILQVVLIAGIVLVLIITVFYPQMQKFFESMLGTITAWFEGKGSAPFK